MAARALYGQALETFRAFDFSGGLDLKTAPPRLAQLATKNRWLTKATNVVYNTDGSVSKRWGMRSISTASGFNTVGILGGVKYKTVDGTIRDVVATSNGDVFRVATNGTTTTLKTGLSIPAASISWAVYNDLLHMAMGTDVPQKYDGTTWSALGGSSPNTAAVFVAHGNRLFATAMGDGSPTSPRSRLYWCKLNNTLDWSGTTDAGFLDVNANDGAYIGTIIASNQELAILKENRPYRLQGIGPATGFTVADHLMPAGGSVGSNSNRGAAFAANDVWYVSGLGVHRLSGTQNFGDIEESFVSARVQPYFRAASTVVDPFLGLNKTVYHPASPILHYDRSSNILMTAGLTQGTSTYQDRILAYDLGINAWAVWALGTGMNLSALWPAENRSTQEAETWLGLYDTVAGNAQVAAFDRSATSDFGAARAAVAISAQVRHVSNLDAPGVEKTPRRLYLAFAKESSTTTMTLNLYLDFKTTAAFTTTFDITSATAETMVIKRIDLPSGLACEYLEVDLTQATVGKTFTLYGYEVMWRPRRTIRRAE